MALTINTNIASLNAQRNLGKSQGTLSKSLQRLSSGLRINSAKDDAAGLAISNRMASQVRGLNQAARNANDAISLAQTAEGALQESSSILQRVRELSVQSANDTNTDSDRVSIQAEVSQLISELDRIATTTAFNGKNLLDGTMGTSIFQVGANAGQTISMSINSALAADLGTAGDVVPGGTFTGAGSITDAVAADQTALTINNVAIDNLGGGVQAGSAKTLAVAINAALTGVTATATETTFDLGAVTAQVVTTNNLTAGDFAINGTDILGALDGGSATFAQDFADLINAQKTTTGVTATLEGGSMILSDASGGNIQIESDGDAFGVSPFAGAQADISAAEASTSYGGISLVSTGELEINVAAAGGGTTMGTGIYHDTTVTMANVDISTQSGANSTLASIDIALSELDSFRGELGAAQNRFESTIANLQNVSENISAARSRIVDADFAAETASLTKSQILQQAGVAMLAQANQLPQTVLSLLQ
ncbi:MAG: flagellin [Deltaproteobacteria bacterium]|jgi:flagellin|nr:flagellin [Deltaproteobacteria bacterium]